MKFTPTNGRTPDAERIGDKPLRLQYRNGTLSRWTYRFDQIPCWANRDYDYDIVGVAFDAPDPPYA